MKIRMIFLAAALSAALSVQGRVALTGLTVEGRTCPAGLDIAVPRFGWQIVSDRNNVVQEYYRIIVASSPEILAGDTGDVWDSGTVRSDSSQWVAFKAAAALKPNRRYWWKVTAGTNRGRTGWSEPACWSTGLLRPDNWQGRWIGLDSLMPWDSDRRHSRISSRYLRKTFTAAAKPVRATVHISGLGLYTLYINGSRVGDDVLTPVPTDYTKTVAYDTYDITRMLHGGSNAVGVVLAGGHYFAQTQNYQTNVRTTYGYPKLIADIIIEYQDGTVQTIATDTSWRICADGGVRYANEYDGELFDARREPPAWATPEFDDSRWEEARAVYAPGGVLRGNITPPMGVYSTSQPVAIHRHGRRHIIDFGTNGAGRIRMNMRAGRGDTVTIRHAELLAPGDSTLYTDNLRSAGATARYVSDGTPRPWAPKFTYYGFRYAEITGADSIGPGDVVRELIADRMDDAHNGFHAETEDGSTMLDDIVMNARRGIRSNYKGMPVDCPQRDERMPWLGDRTTGCLGESYTVNNHALYTKWVADICQSQRRDGNISDVAPAYWRLYTGNVTWPAALPFACDMLYRQYGDIRPMQESYGAIRKFMTFIRGRNSTGSLIASDRYGDWCVPPEHPGLVHSKDPARQTDGRLIASAYYHHLCRMMQRYAGMFGYSSDEAWFAGEAARVKAAVNDTFLVAGRYSNATVTANLLPLAMGIAPDSAAASIADSIVAAITVKHGMHVSCGVIGIQWLMRWLADTGHGELAYRMAVTDTYPGWGYMVRQGATTVWELWNGDTAAPSMNSGNHVMLLGDLLPWCYERLAGIRPDESRPGFRHIIFAPDTSISGLRSVTASHCSPYGVIRSSWRREHGGRTVLSVCVPPNTTAEVRLPGRKTKQIGSGTHRFTF